SDPDIVGAFGRPDRTAPGKRPDTGPRSPLYEMDGRTAEKLPLRRTKRSRSTPRPTDGALRCRPECRPAAAPWWGPWPRATGLRSRPVKRHRSWPWGGSTGRWMKGQGKPLAAIAPPPPTNRDTPAPTAARDRQKRRTNASLSDSDDPR